MKGIGTMRVKAGRWLVVCGCTVLTACTAASPNGPDANVTTPAVGRPVPPASEGAALSSEAFTPYADIGASSSDGLALSDTYQALGSACMTAAGYSQYASSASFGFRANRGLGFPQDYGPWGYIGLSDAKQYGFVFPGGQVIDGGPNGPTPSSLPTAVQAAEGKCANIVSDFNNAMFAGPLAGIETMNNEISTDVITDPTFKRATAAWSACMARNGYTTSDADSFALNELDAVGQRVVGPGSVLPSTPTPAQNRAQIAMAVTDADCTLSSDLGGIYFAVQASYEQQFVSANQQALNVAVRKYKAAFAKELSKIPQLLRTVSATPSFPGGRKVRPGGNTPKRSATSTQPAG
jgi:hypothetical protein